MSEPRSPIPISSMRGLRNIAEFFHPSWRALEEERKAAVVEYDRAAKKLSKAREKVEAARKAEGVAARAAAELQGRLDKIQVAQAAMDPLEKQALDRRRETEKAAAA